MGRENGKRKNINWKTKRKKRIKGEKEEARKIEVIKINSDFDKKYEEEVNCL